MTLSSALVVSGLLTGCSPVERETWLDRREAEGICFEVNLADGLSEANTGELNDLYDCLNQTGNLEPLRGLMGAMEAETRAGEPVGVAIARLVNEAIASAAGGLSELLSAAGDAARWLTDEDSEVDAVIDLSLELVYGRPADEVRGGEVTLNSDASLDAGVIKPALPAARSVTRVLLDESLAPLSILDEVADSEASIRALHTAAAILEDEALAPTVARLPANLGGAIDAARSPDNDLWSGASGDSLRDLLELLILGDGSDGRSVLAQVADPLLPVLDDVQVRSRLRGALEALRDGDNLDALPPQLVYLVSVDARGETLAVDGDSALAALVRLLSDTDGPMTCSIEIDLLPGDWGTIELFELTIDNLAEELLTLIAGWEVDQVTGSVGLLGDLLGLEITDDILYGVADSGACTLLNSRVIDDLYAIDRFNDPAAPDLLPLLLEVLAAVHDPDGSSDRIPELVDLAGVLHKEDVAPPLAEALRDLGWTPLVSDLFTLLPVLLEPGDELEDYSWPDGVRPLDFEAAWDIVRAGLAPDDDDQSPVDRLTPLLSAAMVQEGTWTAAGQLGALLQEPEARVAGLASWLADFAEADPLLENTRAGLDALLEPGRLEPVLRIAEVEAVLDAAFATELTAEGPAPWLARMAIGGTLDDLLWMLDGLMDLIDGAPPGNTSATVSRLKP